jgi:transcription initiation factor TFIIF subunit alpha
MSANVFGARDEREVDEEEEKALKQSSLRKNLGRGVRKALRGKEGNFMYGSDSGSDPYRPSVSTV